MSAVRIKRPIAIGFVICDLWIVRYDFDDIRMDMYECVRLPVQRKKTEPNEILCFHECGPVRMNG